ncbi:hypothetical protein ACFLTN_06140 [Chloroflexota bacterium]
MSNNYVRCYIGNVLLDTLQQVQKQTGCLDEWQLFDASVFDHKTSYGYEPELTIDEALIEAVAKRCSIIAETKQPEKSPPSLIWKDALLIVDVLTLLSLAHARHCIALLVEKQLEHSPSLSPVIIPPTTTDSSEIVSFSDLSKFVSAGLGLFKGNRTSLEDNGFIPSIYWYHQSQQALGMAPSVLAMALYWVSLEIVATAYIRINGIAVSHKIDIAKTFIHDKGYSGTAWNFLNSVVDDWYSIRNFLFHEGKESPALDKHKRGVLLQQVRDFMSLVLVEMLQDQGETRRKQVADQISKYS